MARLDVRPPSHARACPCCQPPCILPPPANTLALRPRRVNVFRFRATGSPCLLDPTSNYDYSDSRLWINAYLRSCCIALTDRPDMTQTQKVRISCTLLLLNISFTIDFTSNLSGLFDVFRGYMLVVSIVYFSSKHASEYSR